MSLKVVSTVLTIPVYIVYSMHVILSIDNFLKYRVSVARLLVGSQFEKSHQIHQ
jgi:hypothetical protein